MISVDICIVIGHLIYSQLLNQNFDENRIKSLGNAIYYALMSANWILMAGMSVTTAILAIQWLKQRCNKNNKITQSIEVTQEKAIDEKSLDELNNVQTQNYLAAPDLNDSKEGFCTKQKPIPPNKKPGFLRRKPEISYIYTDRYDSAVEEAKFNIP